MNFDRQQARAVIERARSEQRVSLSPGEVAKLADAYQIPTPSQSFVTSAEEAGTLVESDNTPKVVKIVADEILHKTDVGGVVTDVVGPESMRDAFSTVVNSARSHEPDAQVKGALIQDQVPEGVEVIIGATTDPVFGKLVGFGIGGIMVEVLKDITFRLAPTSREQASQMLDEISGSALLDGVRGKPAIQKDSLVDLICSVGQLVSDCPEIDEIDLNPVIATSTEAVAVDVRIILNFEEKVERPRPSRDEILAAMTRIMRPSAVAVVGASAEDGKIGNSVMRNLIDGGYQGHLYPVHPRADEILGHKCYPSVLEIPTEVDIAVFCIPARFVASVIAECGEKRIAGAVLIPSGFAEIGEHELQQEVVLAARENNVRLLGPNIYGFYYTHHDLCATFCTPYTEKGAVALSSQSGGVGMAIIGFSRSANMGVSAIVGLGNKADIDEDDLLTFFEDDPNTQVIAMHVEDLKDGRAFADVATRVSKKKPVVVLKAGRTQQGARAASSHTGALAGDDRVYDSVLRQSGVIRVQSLNDMLEFARGLAVLPTPKGENVLILTGAGGSGVLLSDACVDHDLTLMAMPEDLDSAFREFIPPFGAAGNPVDITGGEPPSTYSATIDLALNEERIHSLVVGYWHTIITPPMVFAELLAESVAAARNKGIDKPVVCSLVGDVEVEQACDFLNERQILAYPYTAEKPVAVLGAKYRWARQADLL